MKKRDLSSFVKSLKQIIDKKNRIKSLNLIDLISMIPKHFHKSNSKKVILLSSILLLLLAISGIVYFNQTASATYIIIDNQKIGLTANESVGRKLIEDYLKKQGESIGKIAKTHDNISYENVRVSKGTLLEQKLTLKKLEQNLTYYVDGYELDVSGQRIAILPNQSDVDTVLNKIKDYFANPSESNKVSSVEIKEDISIRNIETKPDQIQSVDAVFALLKNGKTASTEYTVQSNDSLWLIARNHDMRVKEILASNPGFTEETTLQPGEQIKLVSSAPYLTVISKGVYTSEETIPFDVITKTDYNLGYGKIKIQKEGKDGSKIVTYSYVKENGEDINKSVIDEKVVQTATDQVVLKGPNQPRTVAYASSRGSGKVSGMIWPLHGQITSYYGSRSRGFHTGLDIAGDMGEPYVAAASGTVASAGWDGGYGNMILLDNGNGVMTRYAHSSKLLVKAGQHVNRGQTIGYVGSTGNSTGPHLHFEIIINGDTVNPLRYLP